MSVSTGSVQVMQRAFLCFMGLFLFSFFLTMLASKATIRRTQGDGSVVSEMIRKTVPLYPGGYRTRVQAGLMPSESNKA